MDKSQELLALLLVSAGLFCANEASLYVSKLSDSQAKNLEKALSNEMLQPAFYVAATTRFSIPDNSGRPLSGSTLKLENS